MTFAESMETADMTLLKTFGRVMSIDGKDVLAVVDEDTYRERQAKKQQDYAEGIWETGQLLFCRLEDLGYRPEMGTLLVVDGKEWHVTEVSCGEKLLEITLEANQA